MTAKQQEQTPNEIYVCDGCGSPTKTEHWTQDKYLSCCPERKPVKHTITRADLCAPTDKEVVDIDDLANFIRKVDGNNDVGAGALAEQIVAYLNTRTAKAMQGDKTIAWENRTWPNGLNRYMTDKKYQAQPESIKKWYKPYRCSNCAAKVPNGDKGEALRKWNIANETVKSSKTDTPEKWHELEKAVMHILVVHGDEIEAALTPESEGIAGKGDVETLLSEIWHYLVNAKLSDTTPCYGPILERMEKLRSTLTRTHEIDVEALKRVAREGSCDRVGMDEQVRDACERTIDWAIDHLAASGRLK